MGMSCPKEQVMDFEHIFLIIKIVHKYFVTLLNPPSREEAINIHLNIDIQKFKYLSDCKITCILGQHVMVKPVECLSAVHPPVHLQSSLF